MTDTEKAIKIFEDATEANMRVTYIKSDLLKIALSALREKMERDKGCGCPCGETDQTFCETCNRIRVQAIKEKLDRDNPKPLTLEKLKKRTGKAVWYQPIKGKGYWRIIKDRSYCYGPAFHTTDRAYLREEEYGKTWLAYDHEPKEGA
ncbi:MAG: hypothetical protein PHE61_08840 [Candidatus Omnitrophica bacterium]|nr:hypothetical protein [Candidatus Omnitrophota bacterium]